MPQKPIISYLRAMAYRKLSEPASVQVIIDVLAHLEHLQGTPRTRADLDKAARAAIAREAPTWRDGSPLTGIEWMELVYTARNKPY